VSSPEHDRFVDSYVPYLCHRIETLLPKPFHDSLAERGLNAQTWHTIAMLYSHGDCSVGELAELTLNSQPTQTRIVAVLEADGHAVQIPDGDRRRRVVRLTPVGQRMTRGLVAEAKTLELQMLDVLSAGERSQLLDLLIRVASALEPDQ
jgi:MarR family transcriptional regulator, organic hydroperoxide resistance regulator